MKSTNIPVRGTCTACEKMIKMSVEDVQGVMSCNIEGASNSTRAGNCLVEFDETKISEKEIKHAIPKQYLR